MFSTSPLSLLLGRSAVSTGGYEEIKEILDLLVSEIGSNFGYEAHVQYPPQKSVTATFAVAFALLSW